GAILEAHGLTGAIRGKWKDTKTGKVLRPDFVILDDPQTRESAESVSQCDQRERTITGDVLGLAGPRKRIAAVMPCTIIRKGDLSDRFLDHKLHPEWQGETCSLVHKWPTAQDTLWKQYAEIYREETSEGRGFAAATEFYSQHQEAMDAGAEVSWEHRVRDGEISALQTAENLLLESGDQFWAEYQNEPKALIPSALELLPYVVAARVNGQTRRHVPENTAFIAGFADVNADQIRWALAAITNSRCISIIDYGMHPGNDRLLIDNSTPTETDDLCVIRGLTGIGEMMDRVTLQKGDQPAQIDLMLVDCGAQWMQAVFDWLGRRNTKVPWEASRGWSSRSYRPSKARIGKPGEQWHRARWPGKGKVYVHNADYWRFRQQKGWLLPTAASDAISFFGEKGERHTLFADGVCAEPLISYAETDVGEVYQWGLTGRNDWGDVATGLFVAASILGAQPISQTADGANRQRKGARVVIGRPSHRKAMR
ncbi:MAG: hypothetical protein WC378_13585, partial [Opitutaceae bacterium]